MAKVEPSGFSLGGFPTGTGVPVGVHTEAVWRVMAADQTPPIPGLAGLAKGEDGRIMISGDRAPRD